MSFELFIASRYLVSRRKQTFISVISLMSVLGVAIGVAALVVVMASTTVLPPTSATASWAPIPT